MKSIPRRPNPEAAGALAARALGYLAMEPDRLGRFLALSGLDASEIRTASGEPGFLPAVLDHLLSDERLLLAFAEAEGVAPEQIGEARLVLGGPPPEHSM